MTLNFVNFMNKQTPKFLWVRYWDKLIKKNWKYFEFLWHHTVKYFLCVATIQAQELSISAILPSGLSHVCTKWMQGSSTNGFKGGTKLARFLIDTRRSIYIGHISHKIKFFTFFTFSGNHYGTPKPSKEAGRNDLGSNNSNNSTNNNQTTGVVHANSNGGVNFLGAHPSSEGKRRRNRSNVEAMTAKHFQDEKEDLTSPANG